MSTLRTRFTDSDWRIHSQAEISASQFPYSSSELIINRDTGELRQGPGESFADCAYIGSLVRGTATGGLLFVDAAATGTGERGNLMRPFPTLAAAKAAAQPGDLVWVWPGTYNERNWLKDEVNWHLMPGANVVYTGSYDGPMLSDDAHGANGPVRCSITGHGTVEHAGTPATELNDAATLCVSNAQSHITLMLPSLRRAALNSGNPNPCALLVKGGTVRGRVETGLTSLAYDALIVTGGDVQLYCGLLAGGDGEVPGNAVEVTGGKCHLVLPRGTAAGGESVLKCDGGELVAYVDDLDGGASVECGGGTMRVHNARTAAPMTCTAGTLTLVNCAVDAIANEYIAPLTVQGGTALLVSTLLQAHATQPSIAADEPVTVQAMGSMANKEVGANVTVLGHLLVADAAAQNGDVATASARGTHSWQ